MYLFRELKGDEARHECASRPPFGVGLVNDHIERVEIWCTEFKDPGPDYTEFRMYDAAGALIATRRIGGY